jgi:hypothetical protein
LYIALSSASGAPALRAQPSADPDAPFAARENLAGAKEKARRLLARGL